MRTKGQVNNKERNHATVRKPQQPVQGRQLPTNAQRLSHQKESARPQSRRRPTHQVRHPEKLQVNSDDPFRHAEGV